MWAEGACQLCGYQGRAHEVSVRLALFTDGRYEAVRRCSDVAACKERVATAAETWPLADDASAVLDKADRWALGLLRTGSDDRFLAHATPPQARRLLGYLRRHPEHLPPQSR